MAQVIDTANMSNSVTSTDQDTLPAPLSGQTSTSGDGAATVIERLSLQALALAATHATPPNPIAYSVWYSYASQTIPALNEFVDKIVATGAHVSTADLQRINERFLSDLALKRGLGEVGDAFKLKMLAVTQSISAGEASTERFCEDVQRLAARSSRQSDAAGLQEIAGQIRSLGNAQVRQMRTLSDELTIVKMEVFRLQDEMERLREESQTDHLTQLSNRRHFDEELALAVQETRSTHNNLCLLVADIDHFKTFNDRYGHGVGDRVLEKFAQVTRKCIRDSDLAARIGGEEFAVVLPETSLHAAKEIAERIREFFFDSPVIDKKSGRRMSRVTASFGVTALQDEEDAASLLSRADTLLYKGKHAGRNVVVSE